MKTPSVLAFERKIDPSDALFFAGDWNDRDDGAAWQGIGIREKSIRGTISNRIKAKDSDPAKLNASIEKPNLQTVDVAALPDTCDTLKVVFTLRILGGTGRPSACNNLEYQEKLKKILKGYRDAHGFAELARRYAVNIANGRFLWRNRLASEEFVVRVRRLERGAVRQEWMFENAAALPLRDFNLEGEAPSRIEALAETIRAALASEAGYVLLDVAAFARMGKGQEVFPSQELILDRKVKSKTLYAVGAVAGMHSQKVGNALRTIDTWYAAGAAPIAVEPYGSVTSQGKAYRQHADEMDFYSLLDGWILRDKAPAEEQQHYVMAVLVRGGVFGNSDKE